MIELGNFTDKKGEKTMILLSYEEFDIRILKDTDNNKKVFVMELPDELLDAIVKERTKA